MLIIISSAVMQAAAQTSYAPFNHSVMDTLQQQKRPGVFDVQILSDSSEQKFILVIDNPSAERLRVFISSGNAGFSDQTREVAYRKRINLSGAEDCSYTIVISGSQRTFNKTITLRTTTEVTRNISFDQALRKTPFRNERGFPN
jgi:hypothetical protein